MATTSAFFQEVGRQPSRYEQLIMPVIGPASKSAFSFKSQDGIPSGPWAFLGFIQVGRGVLQGDCLSPLLFNLCFNTFIQHIKSEKYRQFGFSYKLLNPTHWFQFVDDAAVITGQESENQYLLNRFAIWCQWSDMIIRVDKCSTLASKKLLPNPSNIFRN